MSIDRSLSTRSPEFSYSLRELALLAGVALSLPASASPIGTTYRPFLDAPVVDVNSNTATETHRAGPGVTFDGVEELSSQDLILFNGPPPANAAFATPGQVEFDEGETPILGGSLVEFWITTTELSRLFSRILSTPRHRTRFSLASMVFSGRAPSPAKATRR